MQLAAGASAASNRPPADQFGCFTNDQSKFDLLWRWRMTELHILKARDVVASPAMPDPSPRHVRPGAMDEWMEIYEGL
jgi:hypothetical protein